jgi:2-polyprenyl-3-methyl-5-hydroxy-6-metoxy-1,4-benzoquinol methylase
MQPTEIQESLYSFPYHYLPTENPPKTWRVAQYLHWGYEYLAVLQSVKALTLCDQPQRALDFGCGDGRLIKELVSAGVHEVIGVDHSDHALLFARAALYGYNNVYFLRNLQEIDRKLIPVDVIVTMEVLEHIRPDQLKPVIEQFIDIIEPDGRLIVSVPTMNIPVNPKHYQHFSLQTLDNYMHGLFSLLEYQFIHKIGSMSEFIRKMVTNRLVIVHNDTWLKMATYIYRRFAMTADAKTGAHLVCVFKRN